MRHKISLRQETLKQTKQEDGGGGSTITTTTNVHGTILHVLPCEKAWIYVPKPSSLSFADEQPPILKCLYNDTAQKICAFRPPASNANATGGGFIVVKNARLLEF